MISRRIELEGARNFRDLGGFATRDGRKVASGRLFRSDGLHRLTEADVRKLDAMAIDRVFDLRSDVELANDGLGPFAASGDRHLHLPLVKVSLNPYDPGIDWHKLDLQNRYVEMLEEGMAVIRRILVELAGDAPPVAVFHCSGGKDRTGVLAAVILRALGASDEDIVADYSVSERYLSRVVEDYREQLEAGGIDREAIIYLTSSPPERMRTTIDTMDRRWGSIDGYLAAVGLRGEQLEGLRRNLLVDAATG